MMDDILKQINAGEVSGVQFKERILDKFLHIVCSKKGIRKLSVDVVSYHYL